MRLLRKWKAIARRAWSIRIIGLSIVLTAADAALTLFVDNPPISREKMAILIVTVNIAAGVARLVAQKDLSGE